ncbi:hypothetical protein EYS14_17865 [Alteromonadaceae bacterium M269]|nr:hypothetical protein EYS14_17865 [Alteromonadaceae bacterium M269]
MKRTREQLEVFNLSFLDIISCAFGAIVMLILLAKNGEEGDYKDTSELTKLLLGITQSESENEKLTTTLDTLNQQIKDLDAQAQTVTAEKAQLESDIAAAKELQIQLDESASGLQETIEERKRAALNRNTADERDEEVGGIPVDSEYVIFIVDTSGSMKQMWNRVLKQMDNILNNHPKVKGFQVMNDMGRYLAGAKGRWHKDTPRIRSTILAQMQNWSAFSNSSPVEGLQEALKTYAKPRASLSIYILGDEYTGGSYDPVINTLNELNTDRRTGDRIARVHAIGFIPNVTGSNFQTTRQFGTLMREVTRQNRGTFIALPN